jgi:putative phosphoesterase
LPGAVVREYAGGVLVGILSDTHDRIAAATAAIELLRARGAEYFIHCGDVGSEPILDLLAGLPAAFVFGNNDWDRRGLERYAASIDVRCLGDAGELELGGKRFFVTHGDDTRVMRRAIDSQQFDYVLYGHTHVARDDRVDGSRTRVINPGALHRAREKTVATLDTVTEQLKLFVVSA